MSQHLFAFCTFSLASLSYSGLILSYIIIIIVIILIPVFLMKVCILVGGSRKDLKEHGGGEMASIHCYEQRSIFSKKNKIETPKVHTNTPGIVRRRLMGVTSLWYWKEGSTSHLCFPKKE